MSDVMNSSVIEGMILEIRGQRVLLDRDVAEVYRVETKRINEAVRNNPDKFPHDYLFELSDEEFEDLRSKFSTANFAKTRVAPKAFTEKGLYMLATILKSKYAVGQPSPSLKPSRGFANSPETSGSSRRRKTRPGKKL